MRFENQFDVKAPLDEVWNAVLDVERVAPTVPGARVLEQTGDDAYKVAIKVKVGPMSMTYKGDVEITERDEESHRAVMKARAKESRGQGTADADVVMTLTGDNGTTSAVITTDVDLSGKVATMGQGVLQDVSGRLVETFAKNLAAMLVGGGPEPQAKAAEPAVEATAAESARADTERPSPPPPRVEPEEDALDLGAVGGAVVRDRLQDPVVGGLLLVAFLLGWLLGRRGRGQPG